MPNPFEPAQAVISKSKEEPQTYTKPKVRSSTAAENRCSHAHSSKLIMYDVLRKPHDPGCRNWCETPKRSCSGVGYKRCRSFFDRFLYKTYANERRARFGWTLKKAQCPGKGDDCLENSLDNASLFICRRIGLRYKSADVFSVDFDKNVRK